MHMNHDDVIKLKHFPRYWPFVRGIHRSQVNSPHKGRWRGALMFSLICARINGWVNNREVGGLKHLCPRYYVTVMIWDGSWRCGFLVSWFYYQLIAQPGNKTATLPWPVLHQPMQCCDLQWMWINIYCNCDTLTIDVPGFGSIIMNLKGGWFCLRWKRISTACYA